MFITLTPERIFGPPNVGSRSQIRPAQEQQQQRVHQQRVTITTITTATTTKASILTKLIKTSTTIAKNKSINKVQQQQ